MMKWINSSSKSWFKRAMTAASFRRIDFHCIRHLRGVLSPSDSSGNNYDVTIHQFFQKLYRVVAMVICSLHVIRFCATHLRSIYNHASAESIYWTN
jgi:hypothetical protein